MVARPSPEFRFAPGDNVSYKTRRYLVVADIGTRLVITADLPAGGAEVISIPIMKAVEENE